MSLSNWTEGYTLVRESPNFKVMLNPERSPLEKEGHSYLLIFKKYNTLEASANSFIIALSFLYEAENGLSELETKEKQEQQAEEVPLPTLN
jgi:hypothetical protein